MIFYNKKSFAVCTSLATHTYFKIKEYLWISSKKILQRKKPYIWTSIIIKQKIYETNLNHFLSLECPCGFKRPITNILHGLIHFLWTFWNLIFRIFSSFCWFFKDLRCQWIIFFRLVWRMLEKISYVIRQYELNF